MIARLVASNARTTFDYDTWLRAVADDQGVVRVDVASAYWGRDVVRDALELVPTHGHVRLLLWDLGGTTSRLEPVLTDAAEAGDRLDLRFIGSPEGGGTFHPKVIGICGDVGWTRALVGSANFTRNARTKNVELALETAELDVLLELQAWFEREFNHALEARHVDVGTALRKLPPDPPRHGAGFAPPSGRGRVVESDDDLAGILSRSLGLPIKANKFGTYAMLPEDSPVQRVGLTSGEHGLVLHAWPGEMKGAHARPLYLGGGAERLLRSAKEYGWAVMPKPHVAFYNSPGDARIWFTPGITIEEYVAIWQADFDRIGEHGDFWSTEYPRLLRDLRAPDIDDDRIARFEAYRGKRKAQLRAGMEVQVRIDPDRAEESIRSAVDALLAALRPSS